MFKTTVVTAAVMVASLAVSANVFAGKPVGITKSMSSVEVIHNGKKSEKRI